MAANPLVYATMKRSTGEPIEALDWLCNIFLLLENGMVGSLQEFEIVGSAFILKEM